MLLAQWRGVRLLWCGFGLAERGVIGDAREGPTVLG